jgi:hypothetical protein
MKRHFPLLIGVIISLLAIGILVSFPGCETIHYQKSVRGSHGYRIWSGPSLKSFEHEGQKICVPEGWQAFGALESTPHWARFEEDKTGVLIRSAAFASTTFSFNESAYEVTVLYPSQHIRIDDYEPMIRSAYEGVGALYADTSSTQTKPHTLLITAGITGFPEEAQSVYPDPTEKVSYLIMRPEEPRSEELFIHAVAHLYNRFDSRRSAYASHQSPLTEEDFEEFEAAWTETALRSTKIGRESRIDYLYNVHKAVQTSDFSLIQEPPFNNEAEFNAMQKTALLSENPSFLDYQYAHYILGPLFMLATETLVRQYDATFSNSEILTKIHTTPQMNYFTEVKERLPEEEYVRVMRWLYGEELIPRTFIDAAAAF